MGEGGRVCEKVGRGLPGGEVAEDRTCEREGTPIGFDFEKLNLLGF